MAFTQDELVAFAARSGNVELMRERIAAGSDPTRSGALLAAIAARRSGAITALLELGADPNAPDHYGQVALDYALRIGDASVVRELLAYGARLSHHSRPHWAEKLQELLAQSSS
jgi:ankyrin repeat protein